VIKHNLETEEKLQPHQQRTKTKITNSPTGAPVGWASRASRGRNPAAWGMLGREAVRVPEGLHPEGGHISEAPNGRASAS